MKLGSDCPPRSPRARARAVSFLTVAVGVALLFVMAPVFTSLRKSSEDPLAALPRLAGGEVGEAFCSNLSPAGSQALPGVVMVPFSREASSPTVALYLQTGLRVPASKMRLPLYLYSERDSVSERVKKDKTWERGGVGRVIEELHSFAKASNLPPQEVFFIDVGANLGTYTLPVAAHGFRVIAIEALHSNVLALQLSLCKNPGLQPRVTLINRALTAGPGNCSLYSEDNNVGGGSLRCGSSFSPVGGSRKATLDSTRLDDVLRPVLALLRGRVGAVKLDVGVYEPLVIDGGRGFLRVVQPAYILSKCHDEMMQSASSQPSGRFMFKVGRLGWEAYDQAGKLIPEDSLHVHQCTDVQWVSFKRKTSHAQER